MMKAYEGMIIIKPNLKEEDEKNVVGGIIQTITQNGGILKSSQMWGKRHLAYSIAKCSEGTYYSIHFEIEPQALLKLRQAYRLNENILRAMILKK